MSFKPDFTSPDPWEGMPDDYLGAATFIPTIDTPEAPWEGTVGAPSAVRTDPFTYDEGRYKTGGFLDTGIASRDLTEELRMENGVLVRAAAASGGSAASGGPPGAPLEVVEVPGQDEIAAMFEQYFVVIIILLLLMMG